MSFVFVGAGCCSLAVGMLALALRGNRANIDDWFPGREGRRRARATSDPSAPSQAGVLLALGLSQITIGTSFLALGLAFAAR